MASEGLSSSDDGSRNAEPGRDEARCSNRSLPPTKMLSVAEHNSRALGYMNEMRNLLKERLSEHITEYSIMLAGNPAALWPSVDGEFVERFLMLGEMWREERKAAERVRQQQSYGG